jgi:hypothetical protein
MDVFQVRGVARKQLGHYFRPVIDRNSIMFTIAGSMGSPAIAASIFPLRQKK